MSMESNKLKEIYASINKCDKGVSGASDNSEYLDKTYSRTYANDCSENTLLSDSSNILTTYHKLSTELPPKSKSKTKLPPQLKDSVSLTVYHQNIQGLRGKVNELLSQLYPTFPHILCLSEHHLKHLELHKSHFDNYKLGASYCRTMYKMGGVCIYVQESLNYTRLDLEKHCQDKNFEVCAIKIHLDTKSVCIVAIYRAPTGNLIYFFLN